MGEIFVDVTIDNTAALSEHREWLMWTQINDVQGWYAEVGMLILLTCL